MALRLPAPTQAQWSWQAVGECCLAVLPHGDFHATGRAGPFSLLQIQRMVLAVMQGHSGDTDLRQSYKQPLISNLRFGRYCWRACCYPLCVMRTRVTGYAVPVGPCTSPRTPQERCWQAGRAQEFGRDRHSPQSSRSPSSDRADRVVLFAVVTYARAAGISKRKTLCVLQWQEGALSCVPFRVVRCDCPDSHPTFSCTLS